RTVWPRDTGSRLTSARSGGFSPTAGPFSRTVEGSSAAAGAPAPLASSTRTESPAFTGRGWAGFTAPPAATDGAGGATGSPASCQAKRSTTAPALLFQSPVGVGSTLSSACGIGTGTFGTFGGTSGFAGSLGLAYQTTS